LVGKPRHVNTPVSGRVLARGAHKELLREIVKNSRVVAKELSAPRERLGDTRAEGGLDEREDFGAYSHSREARVRVVRVFPPALPSIGECHSQHISLHAQ
jgi:hypothetical protein